MECQSATFTLFLESEAATLAFGARLANAVFSTDTGQSAQQGQQETAVIVFLKGDLGVGKTTLARGLLRALGHQGAVRSPTYTLVEPYELGALSVSHFDLYRLADPGELDYLGIEEYFDEFQLCLLEWPERAAGALPEPDLELNLKDHATGRELCCQSLTERGRSILERLAN